MHLWFVIFAIFPSSSWAQAQKKELATPAAPALTSVAPAPVAYDVVGGSDVVIEGRSYPVIDDKVSVPSATRDRRLRLRSRFGSIVDVAYERPTDEFLPLLESDVAEVLALGGVSFLPLSLGRLAASTSITRFEAQVRLLLGDFAVFVGAGTGGSTGTRNGISRTFQEHRHVFGLQVSAAPFSENLGGWYRIHLEASPIVSYRRTFLTLEDEPEDIKVKSPWRLGFGGRVGLRWQAVGGFWVHGLYEAHRDVTRYETVAFDETATTQGFLVGGGYAF